MIQKNKQLEVPIWEKYALTIKEASICFSIGETKLRQIIHENFDAPYVLHKGNRALIKRQAFEQFLDRTSSI